MRVALLVALASLPSLLGVWSAGYALELLTAWFNANAIVCAVVASMRGDRVASGSLGLWDECLLHVALARLVHLVQPYAV